MRASIQGLLLFGVVAAAAAPFAPARGVDEPISTLTEVAYSTTGNYNPATGILCMDLRAVQVSVNGGPPMTVNMTGKLGDGSGVDTDENGDSAPIPDGYIYGFYARGLGAGRYLVPNGVFPGAPGAIELEIRPDGSGLFRQVRTR